MIMTKSQVVTTTVYSPILGIDWNYDAYLPAGYNDSTLSYPILFMLHGLYGNHRNLLERFDSQQILDDLFVQTGHAMIVIFVDGFNSFYINAINGMAMEDAIMHDLVPAIFARYRILGGAGRPRHRRNFHGRLRRCPPRTALSGCVCPHSADFAGNLGAYSQ